MRKMDQEFPAQREESAQMEGFGLEDGEIEDDDSVVRDQGCHSGWQDVSGWALLPDVCLRLVFSFLPHHDRRSANIVCHHWHKVMHSPSLWRYRFFHFSGRLSKFRLSEYCSAVTYARYLGAYLEKLEVCVCPPRRSMTAERLAQTISGLFSELTRVRAPLQSLSIIRLELDRSAWTLGLRNNLTLCLVEFFCRGASRLTSVCLNGMKNSMQQGLDLLFALSQSQRHSYPRCYVSSLDLVGFFSGSLHASQHFNLPTALRNLQDLTSLSLSYSCLSDELLMALQQRHRGQRRNSREGGRLQMLSLHCNSNESHRQVVSGELWSALVSSCPDLKVKLTVDQVINTVHLARILQREIPLVEFSMTAFYSPDEHWSTKSVLSNLLPQYRRSLQYLTLDLSNCNESVDEELLELVRICERLEQLRVWAFLEVMTVQRMLQMRLTQRSILNKIRIRIYSLNDHLQDQVEQLEEIILSFQQLPPQLDFIAIIYPFV